MLLQVQTARCGIGPRQRSLYIIKNKLSISVEAKILKLLQLTIGVLQIFIIWNTTLQYLQWFIKTLVAIYDIKSVRGY